MKKYILFGAGNIGAMVFRVIGADKVLCFADNNKNRKTFLGKDVIDFERLQDMLKNRHDIFLIVASFDYADEICRQLEAKGIKDYYVWTKESTINQLLNLPELKMDWSLFLCQQIDFMHNDIKAIKDLLLQSSYISRNDWEIENARRLNDPIYLDRYGYKVYSQNDEDGMIAEIFGRIGTTNKIFVEFGAGNGLENNTHFLLFQGWHGLWIEGDEKNYTSIINCFKQPLSSKQLIAANAFITAENINSLISDNVSGEIDFLSIDIDGNDYWVWDVIDCVSPRVVAIEVNQKIPPQLEWIMPYEAEYVWELGSDKHGASLKSLELLGRKKGYQLVGTSMTGVNALFVKCELIRGGVFPEPATAENLYHASDGRVYICNGFATKKYLGN
jgi:hypothetical protein